MNIHSYVPCSKANGPGNRFVIWTQGCTKQCKGCFNPETWNNKLNLYFEPNEIFNIIKNCQIDGVTLTGGDPLEQPKEILELVKLLHSLDLPKGIILFTGYKLEEINSLGNETKECLNYIDLLIDGKFEENNKINNSLRGSDNQNFHFLSDKLENEEIEIDQIIEIGINNFNTYITGFPILNKYNLKQYGINIK